jgi:hypothetical protein
MSTSTSTASWIASNNTDTPIDAEFKTGFLRVLQRWRAECTTSEDLKFIGKYCLIDEQYQALTDEFNIGAGVDWWHTSLFFLHSQRECMNM